MKNRRTETYNIELVCENGTMCFDTVSDAYLWLSMIADIDREPKRWHITDTTNNKIIASNY